MIGKNLDETMANILAMKKAERIKFAIQNKGELLAQKKSEIVKSMPLAYFPSPTEREKASKSRKEIGSSDTIEKTIVGNVCMYMDGHLDVQGTGCWKRTLNNSQHKFYHTKNHSDKVDDRVGKPNKTYTEVLDLKKLGITKNKIKEAEALLMDTTIYKALDEKIFVQYSLGMVKQHSVGMLYYKIDLALEEEDEDEDTEKENKLWKKYYPKLINPEIADKYGMFFYVAESGLIEISAVTRGSNDLTPTLEDGKDSPKNTPKVILEMEPAKALQEKSIINSIYNR